MPKIFKRYKNLNKLTPQQEVVINMLADGCSTEEICSALNLTRIALNGYIKNICFALDVKNRREAINEWNRRKETMKHETVI